MNRRAFLCECNSLVCMRAVEVDLNEFAVCRRRGLVLIAADCPHGPEATDRLEQQGDGYAWYGGETV